MSPFFSIIVPVYNVAPYLRECLDSVRAQNFTDWEAICVDDGSTDDSGAILDEYAAKDKRLCVLHQKNAGVGAARNKGLDIANGNWILFLDADDVWRSNLLSTIVSMIKAYPNEKLFRFGYELFEGEVKPNQIDIENDGCTIIDISKEITMHDFAVFFFWCYAYRRDLFDDIRFPRYRRGEDRWVLNIIQLELANAIGATNCKLYGYRKRMGSAMNSIPSRQVLCDEMDHRLDIMEMIDGGQKYVAYKGNAWLEKFFTEQFYHITRSVSVERTDIIRDWRTRLRRLRRVKGLSTFGKVVAWACSVVHSRLLDALLCYAIPRFRSGGSPIHAMKRKLFK